MSMQERIAEKIMEKRKTQYEPVKEIEITLDEAVILSKEIADGSYFTLQQKTKSIEVLASIIKGGTKIFGCTLKISDVIYIKEK